MESKNLTVKDIVESTKGELIIGDENVVCKSYERDTRKINKDDVFIAMKGENFDGNKLWKEAFENGAKVAILTDIYATKEELEKYKNKTIIKVENQIEALRKIATKKRELYGENFPVIAVTGSVGKTSTKDIIAGVLATKYKVLKTQANLNNDIGVPLTILSLQDEDVAVVEMGMNHLGEISRLSKIVKPSIGVITNIGTSHIGNLGSRENILKAKLEILDGMKIPFLVINNDNDLLHNWYENNKNEMIIKTFGINNKSTVMASNIKLQDNYSKFICKSKNEEFDVRVPIGGNHFVLNALCAALVGVTMNLTVEQIKQGIEGFELTKKRMEIKEIQNGIRIINDSYNASYESMKAAIEYLANSKNGRKIAVLGDMFELGNYAKELHKKVGSEVEKNKIDILICAGENSKYIIEEAIRNGMEKEKTFYCKDTKEIEKKLKEIIQEDDTILIKASNGMKFYNLAEKFINN
ncbi:MAG: UDP-N-acetylmuramoyl-tripeptide--D-alanyl-D-alanine ligase [Clostridia bacterium]|nr:UDP-N-acetylmuramoyl-tripeptide--D-alanyl-D-alanine ligase [Clostridia bacterium]